MKKIITVLMIGMFSLPLVACDGGGNVQQAVTEEAGKVAEQVTGGSGIDMGDAALGAVGGMMLGSMMSGGGRPTTHNTTIIKQKVYVAPRSSYSSFRSFSSGGRR